MSRLWHRWALGHRQDWRRVSVPAWDPSARGYLVKCECGRDWAL